MNLNSRFLNWLVAPNILFPGLVGVGAFLLVAGPFVLYPGNEQWLLGGGDATQHYFGWLFYRNGPWTLPLGLNPDYGISINNSIVYTDSIPLLAIPFKALSFLLPEPFQYFGLWILGCFVLQAWFAWHLISLYTSDQVIRFLVTGMFVFVVPMISLFPENPALASQFLLLAALYLNLKKNEHFPVCAWLLLLVFSVLIHFYLFVMVAALWLADILDRLLLEKTISLKTALISIIFSTGSVFIFAWQAGYFTIGSVGAFGYGMFKINLLGLFNPSGWSNLIQELYTKPHWWAEEPIYLGLGGIVALAFAAYSIPKSLSIFKALIKKYLFLLIILLSLTIFSISNTIAIGALEFHFPISKNIEAVASILRNSGRMFIPVFYLLILFIFVQIIRLYPRRFSIAILSICLALQIFDLSAGWLGIRARMVSMGPFPLSTIPLKSAFWKEVSNSYKNILVVPSRFNLSPDFMARFLSNEWRIFGRFASVHHLATNAVYLARSDEQLLKSANLELINATINGIFKKNSLYIIHEDQVIPAACSILSKNSMAILKIDGFNVLVPDLKIISDTPLNNELSRITLEALPAKIGEPISFAKSAAKLKPYVLCGGWSEPEVWGTWSDGRFAKLYIPLPLAPMKPKRLELQLKAFLGLKNLEQNVGLSINGNFYKKIKIAQDTNNFVEIPITEDMTKAGYILIDLELVNAVSPLSLGMGMDARTIAVGLIAAEFKN